MSATETVAAGTRPSGPPAPIVTLREVFCVHRTAEGDAAALQGASLTVAPGELLCVLGPSGAGKSTLLRVIAGLQVPSAGDVSVLGEDIGRVPARRRAALRHRSIAFVGQHSDSVVSPELTVGQAIGLPLALRGHARRTRSRRVGELLATAGLADRAGDRAGELSGGERQRVALCAAVASAPRLVLADEPTGELDRASAAEVRSLLRELSGREGATVIVVSHDPDTAEIADRALRLRDGRIAEEQRDRRAEAVIGRGGWIHLPPELLAQAGVGRRVRVELRPEGVLLRPSGGSAPETAAPTVDGPHGQLGSQTVLRPWAPLAVEIREITRIRGRRRVLDGLSGRPEPGRMTVVTGRSGSGKTTLLRLIAGIDVPDDGELLLDGVHLGARTAEQRAAVRRDRIGYLPQEPVPIPFLSAEENIVLALRLRGWEPDAAAARAAAVLARLGLADRSRQRVGRLSAGEAQRVALGRALASAHGLVVADEPTSKLDGAHAAAVADRLVATAARDGQTVICATHDPIVIDRADAVIELTG